MNDESATATAGPEAMGDPGELEATAQPGQSRGGLPQATEASDGGGAGRLGAAGSNDLRFRRQPAAQNCDDGRRFAGNNQRPAAHVSGGDDSRPGQLGSRNSIGRRVRVMAHLTPNKGAAAGDLATTKTGRRMRVGEAPADPSQRRSEASHQSWLVWIGAISTSSTSWGSSPFFLM